MYFFAAAGPRAGTSAAIRDLDKPEGAATRARKTLMLAFDRSAAARCALDYAIARAKAEDFRIHLVNVQFTPRDEAVFFEAGLEDGHRVLDVARRHLDEEGIGHSSEVCFGPVAEAIVDCARRARCSLIVIGARSRNALARFFSASVSSEVVRLSPVEVAVVKHTIASSIHAPWGLLRRGSV